MTRKRDSDRHPAHLRSLRNDDRGKRDRGRIHAVPDPPRLLPTLIAGDDEDPEVDPWEVRQRAQRLRSDATPSPLLSLSNRLHAALTDVARTSRIFDHAQLSGARAARSRIRPRAKLPKAHRIWP